MASLKWITAALLGMWRTAYLSSVSPAGGGGGSVVFTSMTPSTGVKEGGTTVLFTGTGFDGTEEPHGDTVGAAGNAFATAWLNITPIDTTTFTADSPPEGHGDVGDANIVLVRVSDSAVSSSLPFTYT